MRRPIPVRHWTVNTVSDHDAYLVTFLLPNGRHLTIGTINLSVHAVKHRPADLIRDLMRVAGMCDVLLIQEAGAARALVQRAARGAHRDVWFGDGKTGQASTPVMVRRTLPYHFRAYELHGRRWMGPGAGPDWAKPKFLMVAVLSIAGERVNVGNIHATPSTYRPLRAALALLQFRRSAQALKRLPGWSFAGGDLNQNRLLERLPLLRPWRRIGLRSSQRRLGPVSTMKRRAIDDVYFPTEKGD